MATVPQLCSTSLPWPCVYNYVTFHSYPPVVLVVLCLRYRHLHHYYHRSMPEMHCLNMISLIAGLISAVGLLTVGSFQVSTHTPHYNSLLSLLVIVIVLKLSPLTHTHTHTHTERQCTYYAFYRSIHGVWFWYYLFLVAKCYHCASVEVSNDSLRWPLYGPHQSLHGWLLNSHACY